MPEPPSNSYHPRTRAAWRAWLQRHHTRPEGIWFITCKKGAVGPRVEPAEAIEEALCFGWIDSLPRKLDDARTMLWFAPRKPGTNWSKLNRERVAKMQGAGLMAPAGLAKVAAAQADGSWTRLDDVDRLLIPEDLQAALASYPDAAGHFERFPPSIKRGILEWILNAKRPETRAKRIAETARLANENRRANQWREGM
jgi:uncharacterized protein YdeI (YjbR/CyaY-like superfamily)